MAHILVSSLIAALFAAREVSSAPAAPSLVVDLTYSVYQGYTNVTSGLNIWRGIRYAAAPVGTLRWQAPSPPAVNRTTSPITAYTFAATCPQSYPAVTGASSAFVVGNEDCLYLNVYAPTNATNYPVLVYIHGGGYGGGDGTQDMQPLMSSTGNSFVSVVIQYRLGAFGFLSSAEVKKRGVVNAGLLDQNLALEWVQTHISKFGGDPSRVTIAGESAGAGSVVLHTLAQGGSLNSTLFRNGIAASPYFPNQWPYDADWPTARFNEFAYTSGCYGVPSVFDCLVAKDSLTLQWASNRVSTAGTFGTWAFVPVTDGTYVQSTPSQQALKKQVNGLHLLVGNNANEGAYLVPANITTITDLTNWIRISYPGLTESDITAILNAYPGSSAPSNYYDPRFATDGYGSPNANQVSQIGTGQQQRAYNIYAEITVDCPAQWLAAAFTGNGRSAYKYQYSVPLAAHGDDLTAYFGPPAPYQGPDFVQAFRAIWGAFITSNNPSIPSAVANGASAPSAAASNPASSWPAWTAGAPYLQLNLNQSGGVPYLSTHPSGFQVWQYANPGLRNNITIADAMAWEGGRGKRCDFLKDIAARIPV